MKKRRLFGLMAALSICMICYGQAASPPLDKPDPGLANYNSTWAKSKDDGDLNQFIASIRLFRTVQSGRSVYLVAIPNNQAGEVCLQVTDGEQHALGPPQFFRNESDELDANLLTIHRLVGLSAGAEQVNVMLRMLNPITATRSGERRLPLAKATFAKTLMTT